MKAIQITIDDGLLARLDRDPEAKQFGRSAVFRRAAEAYLRRRQKTRIAEAYRRAYGRRGAAPELEDWFVAGVWPEP